MSLEFLQQHCIQRLGWTLIHFLWQGAILAVIFAVVRRVLRSASPNARYLAGCATLLLMLGVTALTFARQEPAPMRRPTPSKATQVASPAPERSTPVDVVSVKAVRSTHTRTPVSAFWTQLPAKLEAHMPWLVALWIAGVAMFSLRLFGGWIKVVSLRSRHNQPVDSFWLERLQQLKQKLGVSRPVRLLKSTAVEVPTAIGWLCPVILLPASSLLGLNPAQVESILAHELAHIRRQDYLVNLLQCLAETLLFYHPAVWWVSNAIRAERENCCDDMAVQVCGDALGYAKALATLEELRTTPASLAMAANGKPLLHRIRRLLGQDTENRLSLKGSSGGILGLLLVLTFFIVLPLAHSQKPVQPVQGQPVHQTNTENSAKYSPVFDLRTLPEGWKNEARASDTNVPLAVRQYVVDSKALLAEMAKAAPKLPVETDQDGAISTLQRILLAKTGVDLSAPGRSVVFSDLKGWLMVRATREELDIFQKYIQSLNNNAAQLNETSNAELRASNTNVTLHVRQFKTDRNTFLTELHKAAPEIPIATNRDYTLPTLQKVLLAKFGIDMAAGNRSLVLSDRKGMLMVRATLEELDTIENFIQSLPTHFAQVVFEVKFAEIGGQQDKPCSLGDIVKEGRIFENTNGIVFGTSNVVLRGLGKTTTVEKTIDVPGFNRAWPVILTEPQFRSAMKVLESRPGVDLVSSPKVTTLSSRYTQIFIADTKRFPADNSGSTNTVEVEVGTVANLIAWVAPDDTTIEIFAWARVKEYLDLDASGNPRFRLRQANCDHVTLSDGQTVVLDAGVSDMEVKPPVPTVGGISKKTRLLIFIKPTIIDEFGKRIHKEDAQTIPQQKAE